MFLLLLFTMMCNPVCASLVPQLLELCRNTLFFNFQIQSPQPPPTRHLLLGELTVPQATPLCLHFLLLKPPSLLREPIFSFLQRSLPETFVNCRFWLRVWGGGGEFQGTQQRQHLKVEYLLPLSTSPVAIHHFLTLSLSVAAGLYSDFRGLTFQLQLKDPVSEAPPPWPFLHPFSTLSPSVSPSPFRPCGVGVRQQSVFQNQKGKSLMWIMPLPCYMKSTEVILVCLF